MTTTSKPFKGASGRPVYSKISFVERDLHVSRITATRYLDELTRIGIMKKVKRGRDNYYLNKRLVELLANVQGIWAETKGSKRA